MTDNPEEIDIVPLDRLHLPPRTGGEAAMRSGAIAGRFAPMRA